MISILRMVKKTRLYRQLEWTLPHRLYIRWHNPGYYESQRIEARFYAHLCRAGDLAFDIGANNGSKSDVFLQLGARVVAAEPDLDCCRILRQRFKFNRRFSLVAKAIGRAKGELDFYVQQTGSAYNTASSKWRDFSHAQAGDVRRVPVTTLDDLVSQHGAPDFIKIDVEGLELEVLQGLSTAVPAITLEANLPLFRDETKACIDLLATLHSGYLFSFISNYEYDWKEPDLTAIEARDRVEKADGYCELIIVDRSLYRAKSTHVVS